MPKCYQLVGVPGSGKSTWVNAQSWAIACRVVSTDRWIDVFAKELNMTYNDIFDDFMPAAVSAMAAEVELAKDIGMDIVWDQTSTTVKSRQRKFAMLRDYEHIAVVFKTPPVDELMKRLAQRPGKKIPWKVVTGMIEGFEMPDEHEGFTEIWHI